MSDDNELIYLLEHFLTSDNWRIRLNIIKDVKALQLENFTLRARIAELEARDDSGKRYITDGFGSFWNKSCEHCGAPMQVVRPGFARCSAECYIKDVPDANP